jgi:hypothetical protein
MANPLHPTIVKRIEERVSKLEADLKVHKPLSKLDSKWLTLKRSLYKKDQERFDASTLACLDKLNPHLGYDWRVGPPKRIKAKGVDLDGLLERLKNGAKLTSSEKAWISTQRQHFRKNPNQFPKLNQTFLDQLIPYIGYDWRAASQRIVIAMDTNIAKIIEALKAGNPIPKALKRWLTVKGERYSEAPERFSTTDIEKLDRLNPFLGYSWQNYQGDQERQAAQMFATLEAILQQSKPIPLECKKWLYAQRAAYLSRPNTYSKKRRERLDTLIPLLGYDWKIALQKKRRPSGIMERVALIKTKFKEGLELDQNDKRWVEDQRRQYTKNKQALSQANLELLDTLNVYLEIPWDKTKVEWLQEQRNTFDHYINHITKAQKPFKDLGRPYVVWILAQRQNYHDNPAAFTSEELQKLNSLTPILKREWHAFPKKKYDKDQFKWRYKTIKEKLEQDVALTPAERKYLSLKRTQYLEGRFDDPEAIALLDKLNTFLGYDWKEAPAVKLKMRSFTDCINEIRKKLKAHEALNKRQKEFLRRQRAQYLKSPKAYPKTKYNALETLIPLLGRDWKVKLKQYGIALEFEVRAYHIEQHLIMGKSLTTEEEDWLRKHRLIYRRDPKLFDKKRKHILDAMIPVLGYDWKTYKRERDAAEIAVF